jgi:hypothetical protein
MDTVRRLGLLGGENGRIDGRICRPPAAAAKKKSGIASDAELAEYALAKVAIEDDFGTKLLCRKGRIAQDAEVLLSRALCGGSNRNVPRTQSGTAHSRFAQCGDTVAAGAELLLDTCYVDVLQGPTPASVDQLPPASSTDPPSASREMTHLFGRLHPAHKQECCTKSGETNTPDRPRGAGHQRPFPPGVAAAHIGKAGHGGLPGYASSRLLAGEQLSKR